MSENLIYGADITAYGAVADGITDCSDAFIKAIENGENLISVPYGKYLIKKTITLSSNLKLHLHPNATVIFDTDGLTPWIQAKECCSVVIEGGNWVSNKQGIAFFDFENTVSVKICNCSLTGCNGIIFKNCEDISIKNVDFDIDESCVSFCGECRDINIRNIKADDSNVIIRTKHSKKIENIYLSDVFGKNCADFFNFDDSELNNIKAFGISGCFTNCVISTNDNTIITNAEFDSIDVYCSNSSKNSAYFLLYLATLDGLEITNFKRNTECESVPFIPTLIFKVQDDSTAIIDGMMLDHVINARALSKTVDMTTARLTNPTNKFIYTLECGINKNDTLTIPLGDFDSLTIYKK